MQCSLPSFGLELRAGKSASQQVSGQRRHDHSRYGHIGRCVGKLADFGEPVMAYTYVAPSPKGGAGKE